MSVQDYILELLLKPAGPSMSTWRSRPPEHSATISSTTVRTLPTGYKAGKDTSTSTPSSPSPLEPHSSHLQSHLPILCTKSQLVPFFPIMPHSHSTPLPSSPYWPNGWARRAIGNPISPKRASGATICSTGLLCSKEEVPAVHTRFKISSTSIKPS